MENNDDNKVLSNLKCVLCEAQEDDNIQAEYFISFNGDRIPVCQQHSLLMKENNLLGILDEKPD